MNETKTKDLTELLNELGIESQNQNTYNLIIYNDDINDMIYVIEALYIICKLNEQDSFAIMLEAHNNGKAVAKSGSENEMTEMKNALNQKLINAEVEIN